MMPTMRRIALLSLTALAGCVSQSPTSPPRAVATPQIQVQAPAARAIVPVAQPNYHQRLDLLFSESSTRLTARARKNGIPRELRLHSPAARSDRGHMQPHDRRA